jgi:hypothetical protein
MSSLLYKQQCDVFVGDSPDNGQYFWGGVVQYHLDNLLHRDPMLGPAFTSKAGRVEYWVKGNQIKERKA